MKEYGNLFINSVIPLLISGISTVGGIWGATVQAKKYEDSKQSKVESYQKILEIIEPINALYILIQDSRWAGARNVCFGGALDDLENKLQSGTYVLLVPREVLKSTKIILNEMFEIVNLEEQMSKIKPRYNKKYNPDILEVKMKNLYIDYNQYISKIKKKYRLFR